MYFSISVKKLQPFWKKRNLSKKAAVQFKNDASKMRFDWGKLRNIINFKKRASQTIWETLKQLFSRKINFFSEFFEMGKKMLSRHLQEKFGYISSRQCLDNIFSPILKNSGKKLIFLKNNCFRVSHMGCEARFLSLMVFLSFPQLNFIFRASILNCTAAFFARFRYF